MTINGRLGWVAPFKGMALALVIGLVLTAAPVKAMDELIRVEATGPVKMAADKVSFDERTSSYLAEGQVKISRGNTELEADKVRLFTETLVAEAEGHARLSSPTQVVEGLRLLVDMKGNTGKIYKGTIFIRANHFYLRGDEIEKTGADTYRMSTGTFTSCDGSSPAWDMAGDDMHVTMEGYGTTRNSRFRIKGFPVLWSPYMIFPVKFKRQSGLLTPMAGYSNRDGLFFSQPYFQTLGESADATATFNYMSLRGLDLGLEFRYALTPESKGMIMLDYLFDDMKGDQLFDEGTNAEAYNSRYWLRGMFTQALGPWALRMDLDKVSDQDYLREFTYGHTGFNATDDRFREWFSRTLDPDTSLTRTSRMNLTRSWAAWSVNASLTYYDNTATDNQTTLQSLPYVSVDALRQEIFDTGAYFLMNSTYRFYYRPEGSTGHVGYFNPAVLYPFNVSNFLELEPKVTLMSHFYNVTLADSEDDDQKTSGVNANYRFDLGSSSYLYRVYSLGEGPQATLLKHSIRPFADYTFQPSQHETDVASLGRRNLSRTNRVAYGVRNTFTTKTFPKAQKGKEVEPSYQDIVKINFSHSFDIWEYRRPTLYNETVVENEDGTTTTLLDEIDRHPWGNLDVRVEFYPNRHIYWQADASYDPYANIFDSVNTLIRVSDSRGDSIILDYRYSEGGVNQLDSELKLALTSEWAISYINRTDFEEENQIENTFQVSYTGQCWGARVFYTSTEREQGVYVAFTLAGLGEVFGIGQQ